VTLEQALVLNRYCHALSAARGLHDLNLLLR
jgi:hypothetical protein